MRNRKNVIREVVMGALPFYLFPFLLFSCTTDNYDKGQGKYSLMQAELVELSHWMTEPNTPLSFLPSLNG